MFNFIKGLNERNDEKLDKEEKERKKKEKKARKEVKQGMAAGSMSADELLRLDEVNFQLNVCLLAVNLI